MFLFIFCGQSRTFAGHKVSPSQVKVPLSVRSALKWGLQKYPRATLLLLLLFSHLIYYPTLVPRLLLT